MMLVNVGENKGVPGKVVYGYWEAFEHPVGTIERLPVIIAQGMKDGPVVWLTANIHGDEYTGIPVIHSVINNLNLTKMAGAIVAIPTLNPAGSRTISRVPYYDKKDPNRLFPDGNPFKEKQTPKEIVSEKTIVEKKGKVNEDLKVITEKAVQVALAVGEEKKEEVDPLAIYDKDELYPSIQEQIWARLFKEMKQSASVLIDLHNAYIKSIPFVFQDRVLYNPNKGPEEVEAAKKLLSQTTDLISTFGFTIIRETTPMKYVVKKLHRSTSGAALNALRIPSFTVELGMYRDVEKPVVKAATKGIFNVLKKLKMLEGEFEEITEIPVIAQGEAVRYIGHPRVKTAAIIDLQVSKGDRVRKGDIIAYARDIFGRPKNDEFEIRTEVDGYIFMINEGILRYPNEEICWIAAKDVHPMVDEWPKKK